MELRSSPCKVPRSVLETTNTSSRCPRKEITLNGSLNCSLDLFPVSTFESILQLVLVQSAAHNGTIIP